MSISVRLNFSSCRQQFVFRAMEGASMNYAFVGRDIEIKRTSVNYSFFERFRLHSNSNAKLRIRLVVIFSLPSILSQNIKKNAGGTLWGKNFSKKSLAVPKKMKGGSLWSRPVWYVTRKNRKNVFGSVR